MMDERDRIAEAMLQQEAEPLPMQQPPPDAAAQDNVAPLWAMRRPQGGGIAPDADVNSFPVMASTFQPSAGTEDFDRMYRLAGGGGQGGDNDRMKQLMAMMGG